MSEDEIRNMIKTLISEKDLNIAEVIRTFSSYPVDKRLVAEIYHSLKK